MTDRPSEYEIKAAIAWLVHDGLLECVGVDANGDAIYQLTAKGRAIESLEEFDKSRASDD